MATPNWIVAPFDIANNAFLAEVSSAIQALIGGAAIAQTQVTGLINTLTGKANRYETPQSYPNTNATVTLVDTTVATVHDILGTKSGNIVIPTAPSGAAATSVTLIYHQDSTGGWQPTLVAPSGVSLVGNAQPAVAAGAGLVTFVQLVYVAGTCYVMPSDPVATLDATGHLQPAVERQQVQQIRAWRATSPNVVAEVAPLRSSQTNVVTPVTQVPRFAGLRVLAGVPIVSLRGFTGAGTGQHKNCWMALCDGAGNVLRLSNDYGLTTWAGNTSRVFTLATPYTPAADQSCYVALVVVQDGSNAMPNVLQLSGMSQNTMLETPAYAFTIPAITTLADPSTAPSQFPISTSPSAAFPIMVQALGS